MRPWPAPANPPPLPHQKIFPPAENEFYQGAGNLRLILGTNFLFASDITPPPQGGGGGRVSATLSNGPVGMVFAAHEIVPLSVSLQPEVFARWEKDHSSVAVDGVIFVSANTHFPVAGVKVRKEKERKSTKYTGQHSYLVHSSWVSWGFQRVQYFPKAAVPLYWTCSFGEPSDSDCCVGYRSGSLGQDPTFY